jgi:hypothetical protein
VSACKARIREHCKADTANSNVNIAERTVLFDDRVAHIDHIDARTIYFGARPELMRDRRWVGLKHGDPRRTE